MGCLLVSYGAGNRPAGREWVVGIKEVMKTCSIEGCGEKHWARELCQVHYFQNRSKQKKLGEWVNRPRRKNRLCDVVGCGDKYVARGMCRKHYSDEIRRINKEFLTARYFKDGIKCKKCGKEFGWKQMDAHHSNPNKKEHILSELVNNPALPRRPKLLAELDECEMLCARCHQNGHYDPKTTHEETYTGDGKKKGRQVDRRKDMIRKMFGEHCVTCGDWLYPKEMEFHHRNPEEKKDNLSDMFRMASKEKIIEEVSKCNIVCRNCHRVAA